MKRGERKRSVTGARTSGGGGSEGGGLGDETLERLEADHAEGLSAAQIVDAFTRGGVGFSEAAFRKWVQLGLLPRSRRVGRKGKHQGSRGLYPVATVRRINQVKRLMADNLTIEEIRQSLQFRDEIESLERGAAELLARFERAMAAEGTGLDQKARREAARLVAESRKLAGELVRRLLTLERQAVTPLERAARQRAFGTGGAGGAADLL